MSKWFLWYYVEPRGEFELVTWLHNPMHIAKRHIVNILPQLSSHNLQIIHKCTPGYSLYVDLDRSDIYNDRLAQWTSDVLVVKNSSKICLTLDLVRPYVMTIKLFQGVGNDGRVVNQTIFNQNKEDDFFSYPQWIKGQFELNLLSSDLVRVQIVIMMIEEGRVNNVDIQPNACQSEGAYVYYDHQWFIQI